MPSRNRIPHILVCLVCCAQFVLGQQDNPIVRVETELVQTGVTVFNQQGRFVEGLRKEDFAVRVDGRPVSISFFESVAAGSSRDRNRSQPLVTKDAAGPQPIVATPVNYGRTIIFFLDDRHLSLSSLDRSRKLLHDFIEKDMRELDVVAIASSSGRIGFLQQFTDNKDVLRAAVARISHVPYIVTDYGQNPGAPMTEYLALTIERRDDPGVLNYYVQDCIKLVPTPAERRAARRSCEIQVQNRARNILIQAGQVTAGTYISLETLLRSARSVPGTKLAFVFSDGFLADTGPRGPIASDKVSRLTDLARRAGVVIYSIDARGLVSNSLDATGNVPFDPDGRLESAALREIAASQDAINALAEDTGGKALRNQNTFDRFVADALNETSRYYLLAWEPETGTGKAPQSKAIDISVIGRPDLTVRSARRYLTEATASDRSSGKRETAATKDEEAPNAILRRALADFYPKDGLPLDLSLIYLDTPANGIVMTSSIQAPSDVLSYGVNGNEQARLQLAGVVLDDRGKSIDRFATELKIGRLSSTDRTRAFERVIYNHRSILQPGIYQVRVAVRDDESGLLGSAMAWIVIPNIPSKQLSTSSLIVGLESVGKPGVANAEQTQWSVDRTFARGSRIRLIAFIYNAKLVAATTHLTARIRLLRDGQPVITMPFKSVPADSQTDLTRVPFTADIDLGEVPSGRYTLQVIAEDRAALKTASQQAVIFVR
jgi:VWFA-related protein